MHSVVRVNEENYSDVVEFLEKVSIVTKIEKEVIMNGSLVMDEETIVGMISYEQFNKHGLVRYFIFKRKIEPDTVLELVDTLESTAIANGVEKLFSIITSENVKEIFISLGFDTVSKENFFIDEKPSTMGKYKEAIILLKDIIA